MKNPVGHEPSRYRRIKTPCHLIFDTEDPGHPVKVGRLMNRYLSNADYFEHSSVDDPFYHEKNHAQQLLTMFKRHPNVSHGSSRTKPVLLRLVGGLLAWHTAHGQECQEWEDWDLSSRKLAAEYHADQHGTAGS